MAVNIDTVYQKVLALANKEQRGYITPQEFNLMADKAQMEIYDSYFHDAKMGYHKLKNEYKYADELEMLSEKLHPFKVESSSDIAADTSNVALPSATYLLDTVSRVKTGDTSPEYFFKEVDRKDIGNITNNPLLAPTKNRPVYVRHAGDIEIFPTPTDATTINFHYYTNPSAPKWGYVVVNGRALHNNNSTYTTNFTLHYSEEENLVMRILQLCGIIIQKPGLVEVAMTDKAQTKQSQND